MGKHDTEAPVIMKYPATHHFPDDPSWRYNLSIEPIGQKVIHAVVLPKVGD